MEYYQKSRGSFIKTITFFKNYTGALLTSNFIENFSKRNFKDYWELKDEIDADNYPSKWSYGVFPFTPARKTPVRCISQLSSIKSVNNQMGYGSMIILKNSNVFDFIIKVNFYLTNTNAIGVIFKYENENNYYSIRIHNYFYFVKVYDGKTYILDYNTKVKVLPKIEYGLTIQSEEDGTFEVYVRIGMIRGKNDLFKIKDKDIQRGQVGLASNSNKGLYVTGFKVEKYIASQKQFINAKRCFCNIIQETSDEQRTKFCKRRFYGYPFEKVVDCVEIHNYCRLRCDDRINKRENTLNYFCYKRCYRLALQKEIIENLGKTKEFKKFIEKNSNWLPKEKEKM